MSGDDGGVEMEVGVLNSESMSVSNRESMNELSISASNSYSMNSSMNQSMNSLMNQSINQSSINQPINQSSINQPINQSSINQSINQSSINQSINQSLINQPINQSSMNSSINPLINQSPTNQSTTPIPTIPNSPPPDLEGLLRRIKDSAFVLHACQTVLPRDRNQTVSLLRFALSYANTLLRNRGFFAANHSSKDPLAACVPANYSYSPRDLRDDKELRSLVRYKMHFAVTLLKMRLYKAVLTAGERGLLAYDWREFQHKYKMGSICELAEM